MLPRWRHKADIPSPRLDLCTREVLVMERLPGVKLVDGIRAQLAALARVRGTTARALEEEQRSKVESGVLPPRSVAAEARATQRTNAWLSANDVFIRRPATTMYNYVVAPAVWLAGGGWHPKQFARPPRLVNMGEVRQTMLDADEIFNHGVFNGDPHPGNILLMPDGRFGLIDYGQVKRVPESVRRCAAKLTLAISAEDKEEIARPIQSPPPEVSEVRADTTTRTRRIDWQSWNDRDTPDVTMGLNLQEFIDAMEAKSVVKAPQHGDDRESVGVAQGCGQRVQRASQGGEAVEGYAERLLRETDPSTSI